jgi:hypothetical protein
MKAEFKHAGKPRQAKARTIEWSPEGTWREKGAPLELRQESIDYLHLPAKNVDCNTLNSIDSLAEHVPQTRAPPQSSECWRTGAVLTFGGIVRNGRRDQTGNNICMSLCGFASLDDRT